MSDGGWHGPRWRGHALVVRDVGGTAILESGTYTTATPLPIRMKAAGDDTKFYLNGTLKHDGGGVSPGRVAFGGDKPKFDNLKFGHDNNSDDDVDDAGDDLMISEDFESTSKTVSYDHAGNLIDDGTFRYVYDAWNRLAAVKYSVDSGAVAVQTAEFDAAGRRMKKVVTSSGSLDRTETYLYDGWKIIETRNGSDYIVQCGGIGQETFTARRIRGAFRGSGRDVGEAGYAAKSAVNGG